MHISLKKNIWYSDSTYKITHKKYWLYSIWIRPPNGKDPDYFNCISFVDYRIEFWSVTNLTTETSFEAQAELQALWYNLK